MSDLKRVVLNSVDAKNTAKDQQKTFRFELTLTESNDQTCPIFNYTELTSKEKKTPEGVICDDDDDDVERIAKMFEKKYGNATETSAKKKKKKEVDGYYDIGMGYDESDSFIDNTEAYDEIVPDEVMPVHGGYYINSGSLEFQTVPADDDVIHKVNSKKRILDVSSDTDSDVDKRKQTSNGKVKEDKPLNVLLPKKKKLCNGKSDKENRKKKADDPANHDDDSDSSSTTKSSQSLTSSSSDSSDSDDEKKKTDAKNDKKEKDVRANDTVIANGYANDKCKLPDDLPEKVAAIVTAISREADAWFRLSATNTRMDVFTEAVRKLLITLDKSMHECSASMVDQTHAYVSSSLGLADDVFQKRYKRLLLSEEDLRLNAYIKRLRACIDKLMPSLLDNYEKEKQRIVQFNELNAATKKSMPKKRFQWNDESKTIVEKIIHAKRRMFALDKIANVQFQSYLEQYFRDKLLPLWPKSWIYVHTIMKVALRHLRKEELNSTSRKRDADVKSTIHHIEKLSKNNVETTIVEAKKDADIAAKFADGNVPSMYGSVTIQPIVVDKATDVKAASVKAKTEVTHQPWKKTVTTSPVPASITVVSKVKRTEVTREAPAVDEPKAKRLKASDSQSSSDDFVERKAIVPKHVDHFEEFSDSLIRNLLRNDNSEINVKKSIATNQADATAAPPPPPPYKHKKMFEHKSDADKTESSVIVTAPSISVSLSTNISTSVASNVTSIAASIPATITTVTTSVIASVARDSKKIDVAKKIECFSPKKMLKEAYEKSQQIKNDDVTTNESAPPVSEKVEIVERVIDEERKVDRINYTEVIELDDDDDSLSDKATENLVSSTSRCDKSKVNFSVSNLQPEPSENATASAEILEIMNNLKELQKFNESTKSASGSFISKYSPVKSRPESLDDSNSYFGGFHDVFQKSEKNVAGASDNNFNGKFTNANTGANR